MKPDIYKCCSKELQPSLSGEREGKDDDTRHYFRFPFSRKVSESRDPQDPWRKQHNSNAHRHTVGSLTLKYFNCSSSSCFAQVIQIYQPSTQLCNCGATKTSPPELYTLADRNTDKVVCFESYHRETINVVTRLGETSRKERSRSDVYLYLLNHGTQHGAMYSHRRYNKDTWFPHHIFFGNSAQTASG